MRIIFELTQKCNMKCKYCHAEKNVSGFLSLETIKKVCEEVSLISKIDYITFTGGESLLYCDLDEAIRVAHEYTNNILILTNGVLLDNEKIVNLLSEYEVEVQVSLDSVVSNYHDTVRGNKEKIINNILTLKKTTSLNIGVVCVISSKNYSEISNMISFCKENSLGLDFELMDIDKSSKLSLDHLSKSEIFFMLKNLLPWGEEKCNILKYKLFQVLFLKEDFKPSKCIGCRNTVLIHLDGTVSSCFHNGDMQYGNIEDNNCILNAIEKMKKIYEVNCFSFRCIGDFF